MKRGHESDDEEVALPTLDESEDLLIDWLPLILIQLFLSDARSR